MPVYDTLNSFIRGWEREESVMSGELRYGSNSVARSAVLCTPTGSLVRPLVNLVPVFPISSPGPEDVT